MILKLIATLAFLDVLVAGLYIIFCMPFHDYYGMPRRLRLAGLMFAVGAAVLLGIQFSMNVGLVRTPESACYSQLKTQEETNEHQ